jgi:hypothetical protein
MESIIKNLDLNANYRDFNQKLIITLHSSFTI